MNENEDNYKIFRIENTQNEINPIPDRGLIPTNYFQIYVERESGLQIVHF